MTPHYSRGLRAALLLGCLLPLAAPAGAQPLAIEKTVDNADSFYRYLWTIQKAADVTSVALECNQTATVNYEVVVRKTAFYRDLFVNGDIVISNSSGSPITLASVTDRLRNGGFTQALPVSCPSLVVPAGGSLTCTYDERTNDRPWLVNEATATPAVGDPVSTSVPFVTVGHPDGAESLDRCIVVGDDLHGPLDGNGAGNGSICSYEVNNQGLGGAALAGSHRFTYPGTIGPFAAAGTYTVTNTASFYGFDSGPGGAPEYGLPAGQVGTSTGSASATVTANVTCAPPPGDGCARTQGYWKTHSEFGPAPYDATWAQLPNGASTAFFGTGKSWHQMFWTPPAGGNTYIQLAHQYMAARLSVLSGSSDATIAANLATATTLLSTQLGCFANPRTCPNAVKQQMNTLAERLDRYNNGTLPGGPSHCSGKTGDPADDLFTVEAEATYALSSASPNPFRGLTTLQFTVPTAGAVSVAAYDALGRRVATLAEGEFEAGTHTAVWSADGLPSGTYFVRMSAGSFHQVRPVVLAR